MSDIIQEDEFRPTREDIGLPVDGQIVVATKILFERTGFFIFACKGGFSVKGNYSGTIIEGGEYCVSGVVGEYNGKISITANQIEKVENDKSDEALIAAFLADTLEGVGNKTALHIAQEFGINCIKELLDRPSVCAKKIPGLSLAKAKACSAFLDEAPVYYDILMRLRLLELSQNQAKTAYKEYGVEVLERIHENPYILIKCKGIGFEACERISSSLNCDQMNPYRFEGAVVKTIIDLHLSTGSTYFTAEELKTRVFSLLSINEADNSDLLDGLWIEGLECAVKDKFIVIYVFRDGKCEGCSPDTENARFASSTIFNSEATIKREVESFIKAKKVLPDEQKAYKRIDELSNSMGYELGDKQRQALYMAMYQPICIITGGPGTGKTTITGILAEYFRKKNIDCAFCAPTGRAAKRLSDAAGVDAQTIHRMLQVNGENLEADGGDFHFGRGRDNPIPARVIVVDESSMMDSILFKALLMAIKPDSSLILIGDPNQLPSVGAGNVLSDLLSCNAIPRVTLEYVFRQNDESSIAANAARILKGEMVIPNNDDFRVITADSDENGSHIIEEIYAQNNYKDDDVAILSPTKQYLLGTSNLNALLQQQSTGECENTVKVRGDLVIHEGDKVMQMKNNYKIEYFDPVLSQTVQGVFNGEIGVVNRTDFLLGTCDIIFDGDRSVLYDRKTLADVDLAYAMTVHKAQGCEFDTVIIALGSMNYMLSNRKLLYTAVTRGKKKVIIVDSNNRLAKMIRNGSDQPRQTSLVDFLHIVDGRY